MTRLRGAAGHRPDPRPEPMTAPTNALASGENLPIVKPGEKFTAKFRVTVA